MDLIVVGEKTKAAWRERNSELGRTAGLLATEAKWLLRPLSIERLVFFLNQPLVFLLFLNPKAEMKTMWGKKNRSYLLLDH